MRRGRIHGEKNMRNSRTKTQTKLRNYIKLTAGALLLAITFVLVFAGTLSGAFGIENELQQNGIIQSNVASAAGVWYGNTANAEDKFSVISLEDTFRNTESKTIRINPNVDKRGGMWTTNVNQLNVNTWETDGDQGGKWYIGKNNNHTGKDYACAWFVYDLGENYKNRIYGNISISFTAKYTMWDAGGMIAIESGDNLVELPQSTSDGDSSWYNTVKNGFQNTGASCTKTAELVPDTNWIGAYKKTTHDIDLTHNVTGRYVRLHFATYDRDAYNEHQLNNVSVTLTRTLAYNRVYDKNGMKSDSVVDAENNLEFMANSTLTSSFYVGKDQYFTNWNTSADGSGVAMAIGASTGTSTAANTFGGVVKSNLQNGQTTTTLYAQYKEIPFEFNGVPYNTYNPQETNLVVLEGKLNYMSSTIDGYDTSIEYKNAAGVTIPQPDEKGKYTATITVKKGGVVRGTRTVEFEVVEGDFGKIQGGTGKWGSVTNPYVISNETHLKNLSAIVNGRDALNSIVGSNNNSVTAEDVVATDKTYKDCYFVIASDIGTATGNIDFVPIGKNGTYYFAGTIFGGNDSDATNRTMRTISLNIQSGDVSNVGLFGYVKGATISHLTTAGTIVGGAAVGGLVGYADGVTISNCRNNATVTGAYMIGGFVGFGNNVTITSSVNNADITGEYNKAGTPSGLTKGAYVGGFVGVVNGGSIANCYNNGNISASGDNSDFLGGIAGYTTAPISYCASLKDKTIEGSNQVGGIVGKASGNNAKIEYCYFGGKINGLWNDNSAKLDFICAEKEDGSSVSNSWKLSSAIQGVTGNRQYTNAGHSIQVASAFTLSPSYFDGTEYTPYTAVDGWQNILTVNINAFQILGGTESGKFLALHDGSNKSTLPNKTVIGKEKNSTGSPAKTDLVVNFIVYYNADTKQDVVAELKDIKIDAAAVDYNATEQYVVDNTQLPTTVNTHYFKQSFYFDQNGGGNATLGKTNAGTYKVYSDVWIRANNTDYLVGRKESTWTIKKLKFTIGNNQFFYGQDIENAIKNQIVIKNQSNVSVPKGAYTVVFGFNDTEHNFYGSIDIDQNQKEFSVAKTIISIYDSSNTLINDNFDINGFSVIVKAGDFGVQNNGINKSNIENNPWGSESNPYIIGTRGQLVTLSNIVRGVTSATNSQYTSDVYKYVKGTIASYGGAYFKLARSITSIGNITPIGTSSNVFSATFDGNYNTLSDLDIIVAGNNVGLFGYISGATIKYLTVNGSVKGSSNVGGVVGYALNSTIENVTNNASISSTYKDAPYEIKQFDAHPYDSTTQAVSKVNDGDLNSKYYSAKKGAMSFIVQNTTLAYIFGFAITNANDTNNTAEIQKRTPQSVKIWGSNNDFTRGDYDTGGGNTTVPNEWGWEVVYDSTLAMPSTNSYRKEFFSGFKLRNYKYYYIYVKAADNYSTLQFAEFDLLTTNSQNVGGVVGYAQGTSINKATNTASVEGDTKVGGIVGNADSTSRMYGLVVNSGNITANSMVGGVSGENHGFWCDINSLYGTFKNFGSINGRNGATVGGVTAFADKEMRNAFNTGNVIGGNAVGGVAGRVQALIKNSYNSGEIVGTNSTAQGEISGTPTGVFVGGITGYTTVNGTISNCYNTGTIAAHSASNEYINNGDYVGGIVGFAQAKVEHCANIGGLIDGNNFIGGIVGSALDNTNIDYCYDVQGQRKFRWDGCNHGSITGSGGNVTNSWAINEKQAQTTANNPNPVVSTKGYRLTTAFAVTPQVDLQNTTNQKWEDILSSKINGFKVVGSVAKNEFFCSDNGSDTNTKYVKPSKTEGFAGDNGDVTAWYSATIESNIRVRVQNITLPTIGSKEYDGLEHGFGHTTYPNTANGAAANNPIVYTTEFSYVGTTYKENLNVSPTNVDVYNTTVTIKIDGQIVGVKKGDTVTITERLLKVSNVWTSASEHVAGDTSNVYIFHYNTQHQGIIENGISVASVHGEFAIPQDVYTIGGYVETKQAHNDTTHTRTFTLNDIRNYKIENKYSQYDDFSPNTVLTEDTSDRGISEATVGDKIVVTYTWKIVPYSLATNITSGNVWFGGTTDLIVGNQGIANVEVGTISYADKRFYPLQSAQTGVQQVLVYSGHNYAHANFVLYVKYNNGTVAVLTQGTEYTLSALDAPTVENPAPLNTSVTASGKGNFDGDITKWYTALHSDFGGNVTGANWGSADNPYVISKPEHLLRLSQIVNGGTAWNSIITTNNALCISPQGTAVATDRAYSGAYFLVTADINMSGYISTDGVYNFLPIGTRSTQNQTELPFSATFDGGDNTITYVYNVGSFYNVDGARTNYVGLFGYLNGATISNLKVASNGGLSITDNSGIVGIEYVGGIAGYAVDSTLYNSVLAYGGWVRGETYVGGIVGYGERITIVSSEAVSSANVGGETYVGGIVGKWIVSNQNQIGGSVAGQRYVTPADQTDVMGIKYVGGIAGWMDTSSCATTISYAPQLNNNGKEQNLIVVGGIEYVGALFGAFIGNGYHQNATNDKYTAIVIDKDASDNFKVGNVKVLLQKLNEKSASGNAKVVGGLVGYAEGVGILFNTDWATSNVTLDTGNYTPSFIGGIAGVLGKNATIEAIYQLKDDGTFLTGGTHTITHSVPDEQKTFGTAAKPLGSFVGGIVGYVSSQAGVYWENGTTIFGNGISLVNLATIYATSYAGGIFGALGDLSTSVAQTFENDTNSILYNVLTTGVRSGNASTTLGLAPTVSGNGITAQGRLVNNASISVSGSYVGGIAGYGGAKVRFVLRNTPQDSAIDVSKLNIYSGGSDIFINGSYAGGIAGYLVDNLEHDLQYIVVKARFNTNNQSATRVGGLVGYMGSGNVQNCVVTNGGSSAITASTDTYQGSEYVGGLVGETQNATIRNSVSTGFNLEKTSNTKGGLLGYGANPTIDSSWTFYIAKKRTNFAKNATPNGAYYATVSQSPYGKYILVDEGLINATEASYPTFVSLCGFVGLLTNANVEGTLEFAVKVPNKTLNSNYENTQLAFYNASGSDTVTDNVDSFSKFENNNNTLTIALDMASGNSMQICVVGIEFVNVPQKNDTDTDKTTVVEGKYRKPSNSDKYIVHVTTANFNSERQVTKIVATVYFECNGNLPVVIGSAYDDKRNIGGYDETFTPGSSTNPYTISSQEEWNDFAWSIYTGANDYEGKYVKLLKNITIEKKTEHKGTKVNHNFASVSTPNSYSKADPKNANSNMGYNFAGNISQGNSDMKLVTVDGVQGTTTPSFKGHFDGNGNKIEISVNENVGTDYYHRMSAFPNAGINASSKTTFKNLTIYGTIIAGDATAVWDKDDMPWTYNSAYDIAGFVGKPFGAIKFENCTAQVNIKGLRLIAGFAGGSTSTAPIELVGCVNKGDITSYQHSIWTTGTLGEAGYPKDFEYGTGGLIGYATNDITIDSCLNTGDITGETKVGGLVGRVTAKTTIINSANIGKVLAKELNPHYLKLSDNEDRNRKLPTNAWGRAGGIVGEASKTATLQMFACYNTGEIRTWSNVVGGLVGIVGTIPDDKKPHSAEANNKSTIAYCYNKGNIIAGYHQNLGNVDFGISGINFNGTDAGGIVGVAVRLDINYCYNTGDVATYGLSTQVRSYQVRMGGILAEAATGDPGGITGNGSDRTTKEQLDVCINDCYTTGTLHIEENHNTSNTSYGANIIGYLQGTNNQTSNLVQANRCYGVASSIKSYKDKKIVYYSGWNNAKGGDIQYVRTGTTLNSLSDLTAIMRSDGSVKPRAFYYANNQNNEVELWNASTATIKDGAQNTTAYKNGTLGGYVYVYGCLPQLAVFAVDTYNGLSMNSQNFGKDIYDEYKAQKAGEEYSPYVIRDGIDLMGVQTLVGLGYTFEDKYIEFANGSNNITLDKNLSSDVAKAINMPISNSTSTKIADSENAYKSLGKDNTYHIGKSYHLFKLSAVCYDDNNIAQNTAYGYWLSSNHYYNGAYGNKEGAYKNYATFKTQNILTIGRNGKVFKGSISGKQENNANTVINNLRITSGQTIGGAYGGLFGHVENAYIGYIEVGGESNIWAYSSDNQQIAATGGIVGYATGSTTIEHCAVSGTTALGAYGKNDDTHIASDITYAGGIVGLTDPKQGSEYKAGISAIIKGCTVNISSTTGDRAAFAGIIQACKSNIGGVLGYVGGDAGASGKGNTVRIEGCEVQKAAIQAASSANTSSQIGGILGYGSEFVAAFITGCKVGVGGTVSIKGEHSLGGIAGGMSNAKGGYIDSCIVGANTTIERINQGGDKDDKGNDKVSENPDHGTAIGGFVGFTEKSTNTTSPLTTTFSGKSSFLGKIKVTVGTTNPGEHGDKKPVDNVGGIVGDMGSGANFASGSDVTVRGTIDIKNNQGDWLAAANVGGVAGRTSNATFIGKFDVSPTMNTTEAENVGGFIGKNVGTVYILADTTERIVDGKLNGTNITIGGTIQGTSEVGGFIGVNNSGSSLNIGSNVANAKPYRSGTLSITIENGTITGGDNVGGIVGKNEGADGGASYATIDIVKGTIEQNGAIIGANNVGGIIGLNDGLLTTGGGEADTSIGGIALSDDQIGLIKNLSITNIGNVTGSGNYVGGVVGKLDSPATLRTEDLGKGAIAGTFTNSGTVVGNSFVGGSLGFVGKNVTITAKNNVATLFVNDGQVTATGYFVGGSIGALVGKIQGENSSVAVKFENKKKVNATGFVGGSIGVLAGPVSYAQFVNSSDGLEIAAVNSVGGSVGYIGVPSPLSNELGDNFIAHQIDINNTHFEASGNLTANPSQDAINAAKKDKEDNGWGGVGGAIGVMGAAINSWTDNTYYANGNVSANGIYNVGGIVGLINAGNITISNMLAYRTEVTGGKNVGGIVGATTGAKTVINSAYAIEGTFSATSATKGAGDNVGGIIGLAKDDTDASTSYWVKGYANSDIATYDVKDLSKLGFTTGKATTGWFFLYANDANDATGANGLGIINTSHSTNSDLQYWKRIADAYTASERQTIIKDETGVEYTLATIPLKSDIVKDKDINGTDTKSPQKSTLYATATAAEVTEKGYYMYTATSNNDVKPSVIYDNGVYYISVKTNVINAEDEKVQAQNVAVFYRSVSSSKEALIYNGYLRNAIIGLDGVYLYENPIGDNETPTINGYKGQYIFTATTTIKNADGSTSEVNEAQSDPNTYSSVIKIYYVDDNGTARLVGGNTELAWKITERELTVKFEKVTNRVYGTGADNSTDMTITISNIAPNRGKSVPIKITVAVDKEDIVVYTWNGTSFTGSNVGVKLAYLLEPNGTLSDEDKSSTSENITDENTYQLVARLFFTEAKSYTITVSDGSSGNTKARYVFKVNEGSAATEVSDEFTVLPAPLTLRRGDNVAASSAYDGTAKGTAWVVEGFKYNDGIQQFSEFAPSFNIAYKNSGAITKAMTAENMTTGVDFNGPRVTVSGPTGGDLTITLSSAIKKGDYYLSFGNYKAGNYVLTADDSVRSYSIVEIQITISCADNGKSKVYNGQTQTIEISFVASVPSGSGITDFEGIENFAAFISEFFNIKEGDFTVTKPSNTGGQKKEKEVKWTITTGKNAKEYKFEFEKGNKYNEHIQNCSHKPETLPTYKYTITKRPLTLTTTLTELPTGASQYTYNTSHQGLSKIKVDDLVANDTIGVTIKIGTQSATVELENNNAKDVTDKVSTIDVQTYIASFALSTNTSYPQNENYTLSATNVSWKIDKYKIMIGEFEIGAEKTYNAEAEVPKINVTNSEVSVSGNTFTYGTDTFTLEYAVSYNNQTYASNNLVNAGTYKIKIGTSNGKIHAKHSDGNDASNNYEFGNSSTEHQYVINPCEIKIGWEKKTFVYNASNWKLNVASIEINNKTKTVTNNRVQTGLGNDTLTFSRGGGGIDVGSYTTEVTSHSVSVSVEPIHGVRPIAGNYKIVSGATSDKFSITPSKLKIFYVGGTTSKVYDAGFGISGKPFVFNTQSQNGGAHGTSDLFDISYVYKDKNVGNDKEVVFTYVLKQNANYEYVGTGSESKNVGQITPAHIKVALDKLRSGKATRTFTNEPYYGGKDGASGGKNDGKSTVYRSGEGFRISGVFGNDDIKVVAKYAEAGDDRAMFDKYVNDIVKNADETFAKAAAGTHLKMLVFEMTGGDATNYTFNVYDTSDKAYSKNNGDSQTPVNVYDKDDEKNNKDKLSQIKIEITVKTYKVEYTNTAQSYANADNTYNTNWERVGVSNNPPGVTVTVSNGWMYADGQDHGDDEQAEKKVYKAYTTIRGSQNSVLLGAKISGIDGMELNYKMVNQPILTIGYFVVDNNDVFEIGSASSLMIASYYWWVAQNGQNPDFNLPLVATSTWHKIVSNDDYMTKPFEKPSDAPNNVDMSEWDWDMYFAWFEQQNNVKIFLNETGISNEDGTWGYYTTGEESQKKQYTKYRMVRDFSGKLSESDIAILEAFFPKDKGWGVGKTYLDNFLNTSVGSVLTAVGSVFRWYNGSVGQFEFDGNGYVIEYLNIMGYDKENVGLFDVIGAKGSVKNLHLRNITINANQGNVGGIAGSIAAAEGDADATKNVANVSFHGKITATGGTVGGLFGTSARAIDGAIVLGEISATGASAGGVVGTATAGLNNVVSMMQITASGGTVGAFTSNNAHVGENCTHMTNAVWKKGTSGTGFENVDGKNVGYNDLMSGSNSLYANGTSDLGTYDVISETFADSGQNVNPRQSKRLRDMVSVYLLMYSLKVNGGKYTISSSSWLVGTADGTNAKPIVIANKQNVSLLRELRFAAFVLKANVSIDIASTFSGAFYGSVTSENGKDYKITCNKQMFEEYATKTQAWLEVKP